MRNWILLPLFLVFILSSGAVSLGAAPGSIDAGKIRQGQSKTVPIYITTRNVEGNFTVSPEYREPRTSLRFGNTSITGEDRRVSEKNIEEWIDFSQETYEINPDSTSRYSLPDGSTVIAAEKLEMVVKVPPGGEPGFHAGEIKLNPEFNVGGSGYGTFNRAITRMSFVFQVPGNAERDIDLSSVNAVRVSEDRVQIVMEFRNPGTVTARLRGGSAQIINPQDEGVGSLNIPSVRIPPGETRRVETSWRTELSGDFSLDGLAGYRTGETYIGGSFAVTGVPSDPIEVDNPGEQQDDGNRSQTPLWLILILPLAFGAILYAFGVDAFWSLVIAGGVGVTAFIVFTSVPNLALLVLLSVLGILIYY